MKINLLECAVSEFKKDIERAISTGSCLGRTYPNGQKAKEALIRSQRLIMKIHEVMKISLSEELQRRGIRHSIYPEVGSRSPELKVSGFIKAKKQDVVVLINENRPIREKILDGPLSGEYDMVGKKQSEEAIVVGIRSQVSSVAKNFDTLMERAFAETLNLRLRLPNLVMGEVYLLPVVEYDDVEMVGNRVIWKDNFTPIEKFIRTFSGISGRQSGGENEFYKYDASCLILADFREMPPRLFYSSDELKRESIISSEFSDNFDKLSPKGFCSRLINAYLERHRNT